MILFATKRKECVAAVVATVLAVSAGLWLSRPFVLLGWVAAERPKPTGPAGVKTAEISVPLAVPAGHGTTAEVPVRLWYPVPPRLDAALVLYAPVWGSRRTDNQQLMAELASHGFVVAALDDIRHDPPELDATPADTVARMADLDVTTDAGRQQTLAVFDRRVALQAAKIVAVLNAIAASPTMLPAAAKFSIARVGIIGASFGGAAAVEAAQQDPHQRIRAVINLDGWMRGQSATRTIELPFAVFNSTRGAVAPAAVNSTNPTQRFMATLDAADRVLIERQLAGRADSLSLDITGASHGDFMDELYDPNRWQQWRPWRQSMISPARMRTIVDAYVVAFFATHLMGQSASLLQQAKSPFAEVAVRLGRGGIVQ